MAEGTVFGSVEESAEKPPFPIFRLVEAVLKVMVILMTTTMIMKRKKNRDMQKFVGREVVLNTGHAV